MEFYSKSKPDLILPQIEKTVYKIVKKNSTNTTVSEKITQKMYDVYQTYVQQNKFIVILIFLSVVFLIYRYYKNLEDKKQEQFSVDQFVNKHTANLRYSEQPSVDILHSVKDQQEPVNYPPEPLPVNLYQVPHNLTYKRDIYDPARVADNTSYLQTPNYDYNNVYTNPSLSYYNGTYNTYHSAEDTTIQNPLGFSNQFNTSTGDFISQMTDANRNNVFDYQTILDNMNSDLKDSLRLGPNSLNVDELEPHMVPPYSA